MPKILVLHGARLDRLGAMEIQPQRADEAPTAKSNEKAYIIVNPAAFTHTSVAAALRATSARAAS